MKKVFTLLLAICAVASLAACSKSPDPTVNSTGDSAPTEPPTKTIYVHTSICQESVAAVSLTEYVYDEKDHVCEVVQYSNDQETLRYSVECDKNGNYSKWTCVTEGSDTVIEYSYDDQGHCLGSDHYQNGELISSTEYVWTGELRTSITVKSIQQAMNNRSQITYDENGNMIRQDLYVNEQLSSYYICTYDDEGRITRAVTYHPDGSVNYTTDYTYEGSTETRLNTQANGTVTRKTVITYDENGNLSSSVNYDGQGNLLSTETHSWKAIEIPVDCPRTSV